MENGKRRGGRERNKGMEKANKPLVMLNVWVDGRAVVIKGRKPMVWADSGIAGGSHTPSVDF